MKTDHRQTGGTMDQNTTCDVHVTLEDFLEFQRAVLARVQRKATGITGSWTNALIFITLVLVILALFMRPSAFPIHWPSVFGTTVFILLLCLPVTIHFKRRLTALSMPRPDGIILGPRSYVFGENGFSIHSRKMVLKTSWEAVLDVVETRNLVILQVDSLAGHILPKRDLDRAESGREIRQLLKRKTGGE